MKRIAFLVPSVCLFVPAAAAQWSTPVPLAGLNTTFNDFDPSPTFDGLTLYLASDPGGNLEIYRATRAAPYAAFANAVHLPEFTSTGYDSGPFARIDDLELFFYSNRPGGSGGGDLYRADRASTSVPFNAPVAVIELNTASTEWGPSLTLDGLRIYFSSDRPGGTGSYDIYTATRPNWSSPFGTATEVVELNSSVLDRDPHISPDGLVVFFVSNRPGGLGSNDTWMASRLDLASPFSTPVNVTAINHSAVEYGSSFGMFADEVFFSSTRPGGTGGIDNYSTRFTGLVGNGIASSASTQILRFSDPSSARQVYVAASSLGSSPGIRIDSRVLPLNFDLLLQLSIGGLAPILTGYVGVLDQDGISSGRISFTNFPQFVGLQFDTAFVVLDPPSPSGIKTISNAHRVRVH